MTGFNKIGMIPPLPHSPYQRYLPSAYDPSMNIYEQLVTMRAYVQEVVDAQNKINENFNFLLEWIDTQLEKWTKENLEEMYKDGRLELLINEILLKNINNNVNNKGISPKDYPYLAPADGESHPLSERFETLEKAQLIFPTAVNLAEEIDRLAIQTVIDKLFEQGGGLLYLTSGRYMIDDISVKLRNRVSVDGSGNGRVILQKKACCIGAVVEFMQESTSYIFHTQYKNFTIRGTGSAKSESAPVSVDSTNHGLVFNHYWGIDNALIENISIQDCGGYGIFVTPSPDNYEASKMMVMQQSEFNRISVKLCTAGMKTEGFFGNIQFNSCTFEKVSETAYEPSVAVGGIGSQDLVFVNCAFQFAKKGWNCLRNVLNCNFFSCHFEANEEVGIYLKMQGNNGNMQINGCYFATTPIAVHVNAYFGKLSIDNCTWIGMHTPSPTDRFVKIDPTSGLVYFGFNQAVLKEIETMVEDTGFRGRGYKNFKQNTVFEMDQIRVYNGISSTSTRSMNLARRENIGANLTYKDVLFTSKELDDQYCVILTPEFDSYVYVSNKTVDGFRINIKTPFAGGVAVNWFIVR